jgi:3-isopropylmalate dehydrogenase
VIQFRLRELTDAAQSTATEGSTAAAERMIGVIPGEGIGPEIIDAALRVLRAVNEVFECAVDVVWAPPLTQRDDFGLVFTSDARAAYEHYFAAGTPLLHGPAGGRFVYQLRAACDLALKITPIRPAEALADASVVHPDRLRGVDMLIFRDNAAGLYQGTFGWRNHDRTAFHEATYERAQVERVIVPALRAARRRQGRVALVIKPGGVPSISRLWRDVTEELAPADVQVEVLEVDNACYQVVADPKRFDVIAAPNMFGDIVGDTAAVLLGSRGLSYSVNLGDDGRAVYQTAHGAAHDIAGLDRANPLGQILTMAWMLQSSLGLEREAQAVVRACEEVLAQGLRTADVAVASSTVIGTRAMGEAVAGRLETNGA